MSETTKDVDQIFWEALQIEDAEGRNDFIRQACGGDEDRRMLVEKLIRAQPRVERFLEKPFEIDATAETPPITEKPGTQIGPYKLLQQLGEGGMGVVYLAEQKEPVKRRVALKIIKPGMDTRQVIARFEAERQALAMMDHPNIAKVLDAGQTESGRPYFVMELVKGMPVTNYCDEQHLTPKERLELFVPICQAVQHAHQKGIIHRDLKPSNILVALYDGKPVPKIIDFGVAKATSQTLTEKTMFTQVGQVVGTLEYMSPEQAQVNQLDVDTRSDIYSLGVVLYELLTGETPFDRTRLRSAAFDEMLRIIREEEPSKPSTKVSSSQSLPSIAANRRIEPAKLGSMIRGELDWIVLKAMEKDRGRRYETASKFAEDVQHYLNDEAVVACPPSRGYKFRKFTRRNKAAIATAAMVAAALIFGMIGTSWQAYRATKAEGIAEGRLEIMETQKNEILVEKNRAVAAEKLAEDRLATVAKQKDEIAEEKQRAEDQAAIAQAVSSFLQTDLLLMTDATRQIEAKITPDPNVKLRTVLDRAAESIKGRFVDEPLVKAAIHQTIGTTYLSLGLNKEAAQHALRSLELRQESLGSDNSATLSSMGSLANAHLAQGDFKNAEQQFLKILEIQRRTVGDDHPISLSTMNNLASAYERLGKYSDAEKTLSEALELNRRTNGNEHPSTLSNMLNLASLYGFQGRYQEAKQLGHETLTILQGDQGEEHPTTLDCKHNLANAYLMLSQYDVAAQMHREIMQVRRRILVPEHPDTVKSMICLAISLRGQNRLKEVEQLLCAALDIQKRTLGEEHADTLENMYNLAVLYQDLGQRKEAETQCRETLDIQRKILGPDHPMTQRSVMLMASLMFDKELYEDAEILYRETLTTQQRMLGPEHSDTLLSKHNLANSLKGGEKLQDAEKLYREVLETRERVLGPDHPDTLTTMVSLVICLYEQQDQGRVEEAAQIMRNAVELHTQRYGSDHDETINCRNDLATILDRLKEFDEAEADELPAAIEKKRDNEQTPDK